MAQNGIVVAVEIDTGGVAQRVIPDALSPYRFTPWAYFTAVSGTVYVGDEQVSDSLYTEKLDSAGQDRSLSWNAFEYPLSPRPNVKNQNLLDLYNVWVDGGTGDVVCVTVPRILPPV